MKNKSEISQKVIQLLYQLHKEGFEVNNIRMDNAGENKTLEIDLKNLKDLKIKVEYTSPKQNGKAKRHLQ